MSPGFFVDVIIILSKPYLSSRFSAAARERWPRASIGILHLMGRSPLQFDYPSARIEDAPLLGEPRYTVVQNFNFEPREITSTGDLDRLHLGSTSFHSASDLLSSASEIVFLGDPGHSEVYGLYSWMRLIGMDPERDHIRGEALITVRIAAYEEALSVPMWPFVRAFEEVLRFGRAKRYFDFNYNTNMRAVIHRLLGLGNEDPVTTFPSKYQIQSLYYLAKHPGIKAGALVTSFSQWKGSGAFSRNHEVGLGSPMSISAVIDPLVDWGLVHAEHHHYSTSPLGLALLGRLHSGFDDPDLLFRIYEWGDLDFDVARDQIDSYLNKLFGAQARALA